MIAACITVESCAMYFIVCAVCLVYFIISERHCQTITAGMLE